MGLCSSNQAPETSEEAARNREIDKEVKQDEAREKLKIKLLLLGKLILFRQCKHGDEWITLV